MKTKTISISEELWSRMHECMARTRIFNASEFVRLSIEAAVTKLEKRFDETGGLNLDSTNSVVVSTSNGGMATPPLSTKEPVEE